MKRKILLLLAVTLAFLVACAGETQTVEVTRLVAQEVAVEVTRVVSEVSTVEVPVEVTRLVEVEVVATPTPAEAEATAVPEATLESTAEPTAEPTAESNIYVVESGDNLSIIATKTGTAVADILAANNLTTSTLLAVGQELIIPGWSGEIVAVVPPAAVESAPAAPPVSDVELVPVGPNLLPNPSFEEGWYFFQGVSEWQIPNGWLLAVDEGANTLEGGSGGTFLRPEIRVVPKTDIPSSEHALFVFDGQNTIKAFKGGAPTNFAIFTDVTLQPGRYRLTINFFPDIVGNYSGDTKVWATQGLSSEARIIVDNGGTNWTTPQPGSKGTLTYDFVVEEARTVRVGGAFRSRFVNHNNGWFLDAWSLQALGTP
ncbi:MAG: LysM peptidoglycan-binding domain-containing protein [Anaerolineaceae bacterium]|nr:LysM peptidoglycan-binding domain-containing protein [Anaerolineaceae bacterium]